MKYKNSFFKIRIKEDGTYLDVFPPKEDGKRLDIREVVSFLEQKGFAGFSIDALRKTLDLLQEKPLQIKISDTCAKAFDLLYEYPDREGHGTDAGERYGD